MSGRWFPRLATIALLAVAGCTPGTDGGDAAGEPKLTAAALGEQTLLAAEAHLAVPPYVAADRGRGERLYLQCRACHSIDADGRDMLGPRLHGVFGRRAGELEGFEFSEALLAADFYWTPAAMDGWIADPSHVLPVHRMIYAGMRRAEDRRDLIAWMLETSR